MHDTDTDSLMLLIVKDFSSMRVRAYDFNRMNKDVRILMERCGTTTADCLQNVSSMFMSFELENLVRKKCG